MLKHIIICKWENPDYVLYPDNDPDHSANFIGSKLDQDPSSDFLGRYPRSSFCTILQTNKQTDRHTVIK